MSAARTDEPEQAGSEAWPAADPMLRLRVEDLLSRYERCIDSDELEQWPGFFVEDCTYGIYPRENEVAGLPMPLMLCRGVGMLRDRVIAHREANIFAPHVYRHFHGGLCVRQHDGEIESTGNYLIVQTLQDGESHIYQSGRFTDRIVESSGQLVFAERRVVYDTSRVRTLLVTPI